MRASWSQPVHGIRTTQAKRKPTERGGYEACRKDRGDLPQVSVLRQQANSPGAFRRWKSCEPQARQKADAADGSRGPSPRPRDEQATSPAQDLSLPFEER